MTERETPELAPRPFWQEDLEWGQVPLGGETIAVRMQLHHEQERYGHREVLFDHQRQRGVRTYLAAQFYVLVPEVMVDVSLYPSPENGAIGEVVGTGQTGVRQQLIGSAQAWHYSEEAVTVLWECLMHEWARRDDPVEDTTYQSVWRAFEQYLVRRFQPQRIYTPGWEPMYEEDVWGKFLTGLGYTPQPRRAYMKPMPQPRGRQCGARRR